MGTTIVITNKNKEGKHSFIFSTVLFCKTFLFFVISSIIVISMAYSKTLSGTDLLKKDNITQQVTTVRSDFNNMKVALLKANQSNLSVQNGELYIEELKLSPSELARKSRVSAEKALERSDFSQAIRDFYTVLKYQVTDEVSRKKLAALLYGNQQIRDAVIVLQRGITINKDSVRLRLALADILQKEEQLEAALSVLEYVPSQASINYFSMRGGLAQYLKMTDLAKESYQFLVAKEPENARWWLGLGIIYEHEDNRIDAYEAYQKAIKKVGLSRSSQVFVRTRIKLLRTILGESE